MRNYRVAILGQKHTVLARFRANATLPLKAEPTIWIIEWKPTGLFRTCLTGVMETLFFVCFISSCKVLLRMINGLNISSFLLSEFGRFLHRIFAL